MTFESSNDFQIMLLLNGVLIVFSIVVVGCFGLVCACLILLGHAVCCFLRHCNSQTDAGLHRHTPKNGGRVKLDGFVLEYDAFEIHWRFCSAVFVVVLCFVFFVSVVVFHIAVLVFVMLYESPRW